MPDVVNGVDYERITIGHFSLNIYLVLSINAFGMDEISNFVEPLLSWFLEIFLFLKATIPATLVLGLDKVRSVRVLDMFMG